MGIIESHDEIVTKPNENPDFEVAKEALINLGYQRNDIDIVLNDLKDLDLDLEMLVKKV